MSKHARSTVVLVGRQNVGKSTLLNMLAGADAAIVSPVAGTTRDTTSAIVTWRGQEWDVIDTGGIEDRPVDDIGVSVRRRATEAARKARLVCFLVDGKRGLTKEDTAIARVLRASKKPVILVINKMESNRDRSQQPPEIARLGFARNVMVSAKNGIGVGDLLDMIAAEASAREKTPDRKELRLVLLGKSNVGKSSILNRLLGAERVIVSPTPHTTRDPQDTVFKYKGEHFRIVDTAGLQRHVPRSSHGEAENDERMQLISMQRALDALKRADIAVVVLDATQALTAHDRRILQFALEANVSMMLVFNKWDLVQEKNAMTLFTFTKHIHAELPFVAWAPILCISAKNGQRVFSILTTAMEIARARTKRVSDDALQQFLRKEIFPRWPIRTKGGRMKGTLSLTQMDGMPPTFRVRTSAQAPLAEAQKRFLTNTLRTHFGFIGTPVRVIIEKKLRR